MRTRDLRLPALDGHPLAAVLFEPERPAGRTALISAAMAVPGGFYHRLAAFLCERGWTVLTYDYRGIGASRPPGGLRGFRASARDWAELDMAGAVAWAAANGAGRLALIGHSFGGQAAGLLPDLEPVRAMLTVSALSGYGGLQPGFEKVRVWFYVQLVFPLLCALYGYLPWSRFARGEDLPKAAALEWARWCRSPEYLFGDPALDARARFARFTAPIMAYSVSDDVWGSPASVAAMMSGYNRAPVEHCTLRPEDAGLARLGHLGYFLPGGEPLWPAGAAWLEAHV